MTDREKAEEALLKTGYEVFPHADRCWYHKDDSRNTAWLGDERCELNRPLADLPSLLFPALTPEEKELLSLVSDALEASADKQDDFKETKRLFNLSQGVDNLIARLGGG